MKHLVVTILILSVYLSVQAQSYSKVYQAFADPREAEDHFGSAVAVSGNYAIIGAGQNQVSFDPGFAVILEKDPNDNWVPVQTISAGDAGDQFGFSVSISGDFAMVGAPDANKAYLYKRNTGGSWVQQQVITGINLTGSSVFISGTDAIVGSPGTADALPGTRNDGKAIIYKLNGSGMLDPVHTIAFTNCKCELGYSASISGEYAVVGAKGLTKTSALWMPQTQTVGGAYLFKRNGSGTWDAGVEMTPELPDIGFGESVSVSGDMVMVGSINHMSVEVYQHNGSTWSNVQTITPSPAPNVTGFGRSVSIAGNLAVIGENSDQKKAHVYKRIGATWNEIQLLEGNEFYSSDYFGNAVSISNGTIMVGAYADNYDANEQNELSYAGSAYFFEDLTSSSILETDEGLFIVAYPNPTTDQLMIEVKSSSELTLNATVFDALGKATPVSLSNLKVNGTMKQTLDVSALSAGLYLISFSDGNSTLGTVRMQKVN